MKRKFIETYSFFKFLDELSSLPDKMYSNTYFFKRSTKIDSFLVFQRFEENESFQISFQCQTASTRRKKIYSYTLFVYDLDYSVFRKLLFEYHFTKIDNFLSYLCGLDSLFKEKYESFIEYFEIYECSNDFTLI